MKKTARIFRLTHHSSYAVTLLAAALLTSCSDDDNEDKFAQEALNLQKAPIAYTSEGIWDATYNAGNLSIAPLILSHEGHKSAWGDYFTGFTLSTCTGNNPGANITESQFNVMAGKGLYTDGDKNPFLIAYWNSSETDDTPWDERSCVMYRADNTQFATFTVQNLKVCNDVYTYTAMVNGTDFSAKFNKGDYLKLIAHGLKEDGTVNTLEFYLAKCDDTSPENWYVVNWKTWDLYALGEITALWFTMESSDSGQWGMNTPAYFAIGEVNLKYQIHK